MEEGLRERKKRETRLHIADMAMGLFMIHGFDNVTVAQVAKAANVSVNTIFNYFGTKEDLFLDRQDDAGFKPGRVVDQRRPGESVVAAFRRDFLEAMAERDWRYGFNEGAEVFGRLVGDSPSLMARMRELEHVRDTDLARALAEATDAEPDDLRPQLIAAQILETTRLLSRNAVRRTMAGENWQEILPWLRQQAEEAFDLLESGIGRYGTRSG